MEMSKQMTHVTPSSTTTAAQTSRSSRSTSTSLSKERAVTVTAKSGQTKKRGRGFNDDDGWGGFKSFMDAKRQKLYKQFDSDRKGTDSNIFNGVAIYVNGYTTPSSDELRRIMQSNGGRYETYLIKSRVTHIVATNLPNSKLHQAKLTPVVKPEWITESLAAGKRLSHIPYLLFGNQSKLQPGLKSFPSVTSLSRSSSETSNTGETMVRIIMDSHESKAQCGGPSEAAPTTCDVDSVDTEEAEDEDEDDIIYNSEEERGCDDVLENMDSNDVENKKLYRRKSLIYSIRKKKKSTSEICAEGEENKLVENFDDVGEVDKISFSSSNVNPSLPDLSLVPATLDNPYDFDSKSKFVSISSKRESVDGYPNASTIPVPSKAAAAASPSKSSVMAKAGDKNFLSEFYSNSRLHHISTWGAEFKAYVAEMQRSGQTDFPGRDRLRRAHEESTVKLGLSETLTSARHEIHGKTVMHIDMDCFFVSVGLLSRPDLVGKPVAVTHSRGQGAKPNANSDLAWEQAEWKKKRDGHLKGERESHGQRVEGHGAPQAGSTASKDSTSTQFHSMAEIASCSYEARKAGLKNGMFLGRARQLCPDLQTIPYNFAEYNRISKILYDTVASYTLDIEAVSCDEMFIDATQVLSDTGATPLEFASLIRAEMWKKTGCPASVGVGPNILIARLATRKAKPNGQFEVSDGQAKEFIKDQCVSDLPGVGYSMSRKLGKLGVKTCGELQAVPLSTLRREFGPKTGESLHRFSLGRDDRQVKGDKQRKSVSAEVNYGIRFTKEPEAIKFLQELAGEVKNRLDALGVKGRSICLKLMVRRPDAPAETAKFMGHGICNTLNKSVNLPVATHDAELIGREVIALYRSQRVQASDVRGIGIQIHRLESEGSKGLIWNEHKSTNHQSILNFAVPKPKAPDPSLTSTTSATSRGPETPSSSTSLHKSSSRDQASTCGPGDSGTMGSVNEGSATTESVAVPGLPGTSKQMPSEDFLALSFSQIDQNVLEELPKDIADQIIQDLQQQKLSKQKQSTNVPNTANVKSDQPKESWTILKEKSEHTSREKANSSGRGTTAGGSKEDDILTLPSLSQLDLSCFHALPQQLQEELRAEYSRQDGAGGQALGTDRAVERSSRMLQLNSPPKDKQNQFKVPKHKGKRGRPPGKKKLDFGVKQIRQKSTQKEKPNSLAPGGHMRDEVIIVDNDAISRPETHRPENQEESERGPVVDAIANTNSCPGAHVSAGPSSSEEILFCGAQTSEDVKVLLKEWLTSSEEAQEEDVAMVTEYLINLVQHHDLEKVFSLLQFFARKAQTCLQSWQNVISVVVGEVQGIVFSLYGCDLKL